MGSRIIIGTIIWRILKTQGLPLKSKTRHKTYKQIIKNLLNSFISRGFPICSNSIEILSGDRTKAILPSRGGLFIVTPDLCIF